MTVDATTSPVDRRRTTLYRMRDRQGDLLYVGVAVDPGRRVREHAGRKAWWLHVHTVELTHYPTRAVALDAERLAIAGEAPRHNVVHNDPEAKTNWPCPACLRPAAYVSHLDCFVHSDGTDNRGCWLALTRGDVYLLDPAPDLAATLRPEREAPCAACGEPAVWVPSLTRQAHKWGADNRGCWASAEAA